MDIAMIKNLQSKFEQLRAQEHWTRQQIEAYQEQELHRLREYAYTHSPFYQKFHKGLYDAPLNELPVLTKSILMDNFDYLVTDRAIHLQDIKEFVANKRGDERFLGRYLVQATSGSTGHPGLFLMDSTEWFTALASSLRGFEGAGVKMDPTRQIKMAQITSTTSTHMSNQGGMSFGKMGMPIMQLAASEPLETMVEKLNAMQPELLLAYASIIRILADEQLAGRLQIAPRTIISGSEVLTQGTRHRAVKAWGEVLFNMYGSTDCGGLGAECSHHQGMHLQEDLVIVEVVDRNNLPVRVGEFGEKLLVTVLWKYAQPLIRYELSDSLRLSPNPCPCGRPFVLIDDIQGRLQEILSFESVDNRNVKIHPIIFSGIMEELPVSGWQIVQEVDGLHVLLSGVHGSLNEEKLADTIRDALVKQGAILPRVEIQQVPFIPQSPSGKTPLVKSNLPPKN
jgi:phenylacetate-CoA ligase